MPMIMIDQAHWAQLEQVQSEVDRKVHYVSDMERFGVEDWWEAAVDKGDCEDIVLAKRNKLLAMGWPAEALRVAVVIDGHGDLHAVLTVDVQSQQGKPATYVLDSHFSHVEPWQDLNQYGYVWLERSKPGSTQWSRLDNGTAGESIRIASLATQIMPASPRWSDVKSPSFAELSSTPAMTTAPSQVTVTASVKLLEQAPEVASAKLASTALDSQAPALLIQVADTQPSAIKLSEEDDILVAPAAEAVERHGRHHAHGHGHGHGHRHTA